VSGCGIEIVLWITYRTISDDLSTGQKRLAHEAGKDSQKQKKAGRSLLACALSPDDKYLVTGGADGRLDVWDFDTLALVKSFPTAHRAAITSLVFRQLSKKGLVEMEEEMGEGDALAMELFSASADRTVKVSERPFLGVVYTHVMRR